MKKKSIVNFVSLYLSLTVAIIAVCGICVVAYLSGAELSEPIEFTVASMDTRGDGTLYLTAEEFESPRFYLADFDDKRAVEASVRDHDKISVRVYDYDRGYKEFHVVELYKDGETVFSDVSSGNGVRNAYIGLGIILGMGVLLSAVFTVRLVKSARKNNETRNGHE